MAVAEKGLRSKIGLALSLMEMEAPKRFMGPL